MLRWVLLVALLLSLLSFSSGRGGGRGRTCDDGTKPTCADGSAPVFDGDRSTPPCADGSGKPRTCADGSTPSRGGRGGGGGRGGCPRSSKVCCDGSVPVFDGDRATPPCSDGSRPLCSLAECSATAIDVEVVEQF